MRAAAYTRSYCCLRRIGAACRRRRRRRVWRLPPLAIAVVVVVGCRYHRQRELTAAAPAHRVASHRSIVTISSLRRQQAAAREKPLTDWLTQDGG